MIYIYIILVKICYYRTYNLSVYTVHPSGMNTTKIEYIKSQVKRVSLQNGMAELLRAPIPRRIPTRKLWCARLSPDSDIHLSPKTKTLVATVKFLLHPPSPSATAPPFLFYTYSVTATF